MIRPAYELNVPALSAGGALRVEAPVAVDAPNVIVECVKPCEDAENA